MLEKHTISITTLVWSQQMGATMCVAVLVTWHSPPDTSTMEQLCQRNFVCHQNHTTQIPFHLRTHKHACTHQNIVYCLQHNAMTCMYDNSD